jgi:hypothetical protein
MTEGESFRPRARRLGVFTEELPDELLIYDMDRHQVHCLNRPASVIWRRCDGKTTIADIATAASAALACPVAEDVVWHAVGQFAGLELLDSTDAAPAERARLSRRAVLAGMGGIVGLALPTVTSMTAPLAADAASLPGPSGPSGPTGPGGPSGPSGPSGP